MCRSLVLQQSREQRGIQKRQDPDPWIKKSSSIRLMKAKKSRNQVDQDNLLETAYARFDNTF